MTTASGNRRLGAQVLFELQPLERRLLCDGEAVALGARAFDLLIALTERPGQLPGKNALIESVCPGMVVEEGNLATQISGLRKVLGGEVIATIPGRGYRFAARVESADRTQPVEAPDPHPGPVAAARSAGEEPAASAAEWPPTARPGTDTPKLLTHLPATLPRLVGRDDELASLQGLIAQHRLVTIVGAGGIGKTRVAMHLTARQREAYRHGVC